MTSQPARPLYRLMYHSHIDVETSLALEDALRQILFSSHQWNLENGVTGLLVTNGYWFLQAIEGAKADVDACFERIRADPRHHDVTLRALSPVPERLFSQWAMCGLTLSPLEDALMSPPDIEFQVWGAPVDKLLQFLQQIAVRYGDRLNALHAAMGADVEQAAGVEQPGG
jgi:hypothetical protein